MNHIFLFCQNLP